MVSVRQEPTESGKLEGNFKLLSYSLATVRRSPHKPAGPITWQVPSAERTSGKFSLWLQPRYASYSTVLHQVPETCCSSRARF